MQPEARAQLRQARQAAGLSLRELGMRIGVSASLLSQIERGNSEPSVSSLYALVKELGVSLDSLAGMPAAPGPVRQTQLSRRASDEGTLGGSPVIRPSQRAHLDMASGVHWEQLSHRADPLVEALLVTYEPGSSSSSDGTLMTHSGVEFAYLMEGELTLTLGFERIVVAAGDSLRFESSHPHIYRNEGRTTAKGLWIVVGRSVTGVTRAGAAAEKGSPTSALDVMRLFGDANRPGTDSGVA